VAFTPAPCRIESLVDRAAELYPDRLGVVFRDRRWTYREMQRETVRRAAVLVASGVRPGDVVCTTETAMDDDALNFLACCRAGMIYARFSARLTPAELQPLLARIGARVLLTVDGSPHPGFPECPALPLQLPGDPDIALLRKARGEVHGDSETIVAYQMTSGTTGGRPKIIPTSHRMLTWRHAARMAWERAGRVWYRAPFGVPSVRGYTDVLASAGTWVAASETDPQAMEREMAAHGVTVLRTVPAVVHLLAAQRQPPPPGLALAVVRTGAAALPPQTARAAAQRYGARIIEEYASTEGGTLFMRWQRRAPRGSIGKPIPGVQARIAAPDTRGASPGTVGELIVRSPGMMRGYLDDPEATAAALTDGWLRTGDLVRRDRAGFYILVGRAALRINVGGNKVAPEDVEAVLLAHPGVREVVVLGAPDAVRGEVVRAVIVPGDERPSIGELRRFCRQRLAPYKVPRRWEFRSELPRSALGKVLRSAL
jgi:acyl-coenzyme A synthetase/AMP-(fatty) acid ligase